MKVKVIAILTLIILLVMCVPVYANTQVPAIPDGVLEYWVIVNCGSPEIYCLSSNYPITVTSPSNHTMIFNTYRWYKYVSNEWELTIEGLGSKYMYEDYLYIYASNHDIAYADGSGFFFLSPKVSPLSQGMKETDFGAILRNFSVGLIPIIGCLILVISLRKGWEFLRTQLTH